MWLFNITLMILKVSVLLIVAGIYSLFPDGSVAKEIALIILVLFVGAFIFMGILDRESKVKLFPFLENWLLPEEDDEKFIISETKQNKPMLPVLKPVSNSTKDKPQALQQAQSRDAIVLNEAQKAFMQLKSEGRAYYCLSYILHSVVNLESSKSKISYQQYCSVSKLYSFYDSCDYKVQISHEMFLQLCTIIMGEFDKIAPFEKLMGGDEEFKAKMVQSYRAANFAVSDQAKSVFMTMNRGYHPSNPTVNLPIVPAPKPPPISLSQRTQMELDTWIRKWKSNEEIGREYERYIGYLCEARGFKVKYNGATKGRSDKGRDLIVIKGNTHYVVQCKYWGKEKVIHENHINQVHGTTDWKARKDKKHTYVAVLVTNITISDDAKDCAKTVEVTVYESIPMKGLTERPLIKCNLNQERERIYHLPFDKSYDTVEMGGRKGCFYAWTVEEAESKGFRRARYPDQNNS